MALSIDNPGIRLYVVARSDEIAHLTEVGPDGSVITGQDELEDADTPAGQLGLALEVNLSDRDIAALAQQYPQFEIGVDLDVGDVVAFKGELFEVIQAHTTQEDWLPPDVPNLFEPTMPEGVIPEWMRPLGSHDAYSEGDKVTHEGYIWESQVNANVWEPGVQDLWQQVEPVSGDK